MSAGSVERRRTQRDQGARTFASSPLVSQAADEAALAARVFAHVPFVMLYRRLQDDAWTLESVGRGSRAIIGFEPADLVKGAVSDLSLIHPDDRARVRAAMDSDLDACGAFEVEYRLRGINGEEHTVIDRGYRLDRGKGHPLIEGFIVRADVGTQPRRLQSGDDLKLRVLVDQSLAGIYQVRDGRFAYVNPRFAEIFGYTTDEILALPSILDLVDPADRELVAGNLRQRVERGVEQVRYEFRGRTKDGRSVAVEVHGSRLLIGETPCVFGVLLDISERREAEQFRRKTERLDAVRRFSSGVAHDMNNFLSTIRTTAEVLKLERGEDDALAQDLTEIIQAVQTGTTLSRQLAGFGRLHDESDVSAPSEVLEDLAAQLRPLLGRRIELKTNLAQGLPEVPLAPESFRDIVMNLVLNAQDAMPDGGALTIAASEADERRGVVVEVADTGHGMSPEVRARVFEPHFTTKGERGTGLGLPNVQRAVSEAGGTVEIDSTPGTGTMVRIVLPSCRGI